MCLTCILSRGEDPLCHQCLNSWEFSSRERGRDPNYHNGLVIYMITNTEIQKSKSKYSIFLNRKMKRVLIWLWLVVLLCGGLQQQIQATTSLIALYKQKLLLLQDIQEEMQIKGMFPVVVEPYFPLNHTYLSHMVFVPPHFALIRSQVWNLGTHQRVGSVFGNVLTVGEYEITTVKGNKVEVLGLWAEPTQDMVSIHISDPTLYTKWHKTYEFSDIIVQKNQAVLLMHTSKKTQEIVFRSPLIELYPINQYKLLYLTRYHYGYFNVQSLHVIDEQPLPNILESAYKPAQTQLLYVLLKDRTILKIDPQTNTTLGETKFPIGMVEGKLSIIFLRGYVIIWGDQSPCFITMEELPLPVSQVRFNYHQKICIKPTTGDGPYQYIFYEYENELRVVVQDGKESGHYLLLLGQTDEGSGFPIPWQVPTAILIIVLLGYYKYKKVKESKKSVQISRIKYFLSKRIKHKMH